MAEKEKRKAGILKGGKLICPHCGNDDLDSMFHTEMVPAQRRISEIEDGKLLLVFAEASYIDESAVDVHIFCDGPNCCQEFAIPKKLKVDFE